MLRILCVVLCVLGLTCVGCDKGPPLGQVTGTVTMDDTPLDNALVTFTPVGGRGSTGRTDAEGKYTLVYAEREGALLGTHTVTVISVAPLDAEPVTEPEEIRSDDPRYQELMQGGGPGQSTSTTATKEAIPAKYNSKTTLTFDVVDGDQVYDIPMVSK